MFLGEDLVKGFDLKFVGRYRDWNGWLNIYLYENSEVFLFIIYWKKLKRIIIIL